MAEMKDGDKMLMSCIRGEFNNLPHAERIRIGDFMDLESVSELLREREHAMAAVRRIECRIARVMDAIGKRRAAGVPALPTPKLCPGCAQYHGRNDCPVGWLAPAEPYGVATDTPAVCRLCLAVTGGRQCFEPACPGGVATDQPDQENKHG